MNRIVNCIVFLGLVVTSCDENRYYPWNEWGQGGDQNQVVVSEDIVIPEITFESDDVNTDDNIGNTSFDRDVTVTFSETGAATVEGTSSKFDVTVSGNDVTITNNGKESVRYLLSGTSSDGFFKLYSEKKQAIVLNNLHLTNKGGAAINNQSKKRTFVVLNGASEIKDGNVNSDGDYPDQKDSDEEDMKAAFFSEAQLIFSGNGSLVVNAVGKAGITSDDYVRIMNEASVTVNSALGHGVRGKDAVIVSGGNLDISVVGGGKKGISSDSLVYIGGGVTNIVVTGAACEIDGELTGAAGIKADSLLLVDDGTLTISSSGKGSKGISCDGDGHFKGGTICINVTGSNYGSSSGGMGGGFPGGWGGRQSSDSDNSVSSKGIKFDGNLYFYGSDITVKASSHEAIESKGLIYITGGKIFSYSSDDAINSSNSMKISGGYVFAQSTGNDGLDANGNLYIEGGYVYAIGSGSPEVGIDANTEGGYKFYLTGGNVIAIGGIESGSVLSQAVVSSTWSKNTTYALYDSDDNVAIAFKTPSTGGSGMYMSIDKMKSGSKYIFKTGVTIDSGQTLFDMEYLNAKVSGGTSLELTAGTSSGGNSGPGGPGGFRW